MCLIGVLGMAFSASAFEEEVYLGQVEAGVYKQFIVDVYYQYDSSKEDIEQIRSTLKFKLNGDQLLIGSTAVNSVGNFRYTVTPAEGWYWDSRYIKSEKRPETDKYHGSTTRVSYALYRVGEAKTTLSIKFTKSNIVWIEIVDAKVCKEDGTYYFGVSRSDSCLDDSVKKEVKLCSFDGGPEKYKWQKVDRCTFSSETMNPTKICVNKIEDKKNGEVTRCFDYSTDWKVKEKVEAKYTDKASGKDKIVSTNFTIIAVDVKLGGLAEGLAEGKEETEGLLMTTNMPKEVTFNVLTKNLPASLDCYRIECDDLYQKSTKSEYDKAPLTHMIVKVNNATTYYKRFDTDKTYKLKDLTSTTKPFYVICTEPSREWNKSSVTFTHVLSGASDKANYTCCGLAFITPSGSPEKYETDKNGDPVVVNPNAAEPADRYRERAKNEENGNEGTDGQNEFCFSKTGQELTVRFKVGILPQPPAEKLDAMLTKFLGSTRTGTFTVQELRESSGNGTPVWGSNKKRTLSNKVTEKDGVFADEAVYSGYPTKNEGFGKYTVAFKADKVNLSADYEVFYPKEGTQHPFCSSCDKCPNWFYYWQQGAVSGMKGVKYAESTSDIYRHPNGKKMQNPLGMHKSAMYVDDMGGFRDGKWVPRYVWSITESCIYLSELAAGCDGAGEYNLKGMTMTIGMGERFCGVAKVAKVYAHEQCHRNYFERLMGELNNEDISIDGRTRKTIYIGSKEQRDKDVDQDGITDYWEEAEKDMRSEKIKSDTFKFHEEKGMEDYKSYGDNEIRARRAERTAYNYDIFQDWAEPGCQSQIPCGPTEY